MYVYMQLNLFLSKFIPTNLAFTKNGVAQKLPWWCSLVVMCPHSPRQLELWVMGSNTAKAQGGILKINNP
jgi:hypothetical protein